MSSCSPSSSAWMLTTAQHCLAGVFLGEKKTEHFIHVHDRTCDRLHRLLCDRNAWVHLLQGVDDFSKEKVEELVSFGGNRGPEMMAELLGAIACKMKVHRHNRNVKVSIKGFRIPDKNNNNNNNQGDGRRSPG